jgi:hypothetical protein
MLRFDEAQRFLRENDAVPASPDKRTLWLRPETVMRIEPPVLYCWLKKLPTYVRAPVLVSIADWSTLAEAVAHVADIR